MDKIRIEDLEVYAYHGVYPGETQVGQFFRVCAALSVDTRAAGLTDCLELSVNYGEVCHFIDRWMKEHTYRLIESVAENLARELLLTFPPVRELELEIRKPQAPVGLPFGCVSVAITRGWRRAWLGVGSNMGDRRAFIENAIESLKENKEVRVRKRSALIVTAPYGGVEQEDFLNGAVEIETLLSPGELLELLHRLEAEAGRERAVRWGPRTLDLDILLYDKLIYEDDNLIIPHVDMANREFVLRPMAELAPNLRHPVLRKTMGELLRELELRALELQEERK